MIDGGMDMIRAEVHSDDYMYSDESPNEEYKTDFDVTAWFAQASQQDILDLDEINWGGNYAADCVAEWSADGLPNHQMQSMFRYIQAHNKTFESHIGFECHVNAKDAMVWLDANRPDVAKVVLAQRKGGRS